MGAKIDHRTTGQIDRESRGMVLFNGQEITRESYDRIRGIAPSWNLLGTWGVFEYWLSPDGVNVSRRKMSEWNVIACDGSPMGARWESTLTHFETYVAARLAV